MRSPKPNAPLVADSPRRQKKNPGAGSETPSVDDTIECLQYLGQRLNQLSQYLQKAKNYSSEDQEVLIHPIGQLLSNGERLELSMRSCHMKLELQKLELQIAMKKANADNESPVKNEKTRGGILNLEGMLQRRAGEERERHQLESDFVYNERRGANRPDINTLGAVNRKVPISECLEAGNDGLVTFDSPNKPSTFIEQGEEAGARGPEVTQLDVTVMDYPGCDSEYAIKPIDVSPTAHKDASRGIGTALFHSNEVTETLPRTTLFNADTAHRKTAGYFDIYGANTDRKRETGHLEAEPVEDGSKETKLMGESRRAYDEPAYIRPEQGTRGKGKTRKPRGREARRHLNAYLKRRGDRMTYGNTTKRRQALTPSDRSLRQSYDGGHETNTAKFRDSFQWSETESQRAERKNFRFYTSDSSESDAN
ncbi:hypothetical protein [Vibrio sonorensis]|uniref:hypothetical protein n=1 Tax=Vibrio sonorensis TaxID=1004316 RepID=UPI0008D9EC9B|nr:hypothetical protein [Vibrio sonorensis]